MKQFNKPNEELTDQELQELIMSDRTLASIVEPHTVIGQVYKRYYARLATPQINLDEVEKLVQHRVNQLYGFENTGERIGAVEYFRQLCNYTLSDLSPSKPDNNEK